MNNIRVSFIDGTFIDIDDVDFNEIRKGNFNVKAFTFNNVVIMLDKVKCFEKLK